MVIIGILWAGLALQGKVLLEKRRECEETTSDRVRMLMGKHYNSVYDIHSIAESILSGDAATTATIIPLLRHIDGARQSYDDALLFEDGIPSSYVSLLFYRYDNAISDYLFGNLLGDNSRIMGNEDFITVVKDLELYSSWVLTEFGYKQTGEVYHDKDLKESSIFEELSLKPPDY